MATWQYFNETGLQGGDFDATRRLEKTFYVDSYKGNDTTGTGSNLLPYKSLQKVLNQCNTFSITSVDIIATGYFEEGDFLNTRTKVSLIAEGKVTIKAVLQNGFKLNSAINSFCSFNYDINGGNKKRNYGQITIKDFPQEVYFGSYYYLYTPIEKIGCYNVTFKNNQKVLGLVQSNIDLISGCVFDTPNIINTIYIARFSGFRNMLIEKNSFITNNRLYIQSTGLDGKLTFRDNFCSENTIIYQYDEANYTPSYNNHILGSFLNKIYINGSYYNNRDLANAARGFDINGKPYADSPQFNTVLNTTDLTYQIGAPNITGGFDGKQIGAFGLGRGAQAVSDANWVATGVDNTTTAGEAVLTGTPTGTMETTNGIQVVDNILVPKRLFRLTLPDALIDYQNGYTINTLASSAVDSPAIETVEIKVSADSTNGIDGTWSASWIKVPIEGQPLIDAVGVGNGDDAFDYATKKFIVLTFIKYKITLRDNETPLP